MQIKSGVINVYKEAGYTSHDVVAIVRKITKTKAGHTGTLDPDACGVLPICIGRATKFASFFAGQEKTYVCEVVLGVVTDTWDMTGVVLEKRNVNVSDDDIINAVESFSFLRRGVYMQTPPMYSAVKVGGKKLYEIARKGEIIRREPRPVQIREICVREVTPKGFAMEVTCSKGTYIRSLCMDIGDMLGCGAAMGQLTRTVSGLFKIDDSVKIGTLRDAPDINKYIMQLTALLPYPILEVKPEGIKLLKNGNPIDCELAATTDCNSQYYWLSNDGHITGLYKKLENKFRLEVML